MSKNLQRLNFVFLLVILAFLILLRFLWLELIPNGINWDEAAYGYNSWSILLIGKDEWGASFPLFLKSFGDYKPALLSYLQVPFIWYGGLNAISLRLPVAILSVFSIISWYFIQKNLNKRESTGFSKTNSEIYYLLSTVLLASSPWLIHYSRAAMDPIVSFSFLMIGFALYTHRNNKLQWLGVFSLVLSVYTYNSARVFVFFLILLHTIIFESHLISSIRNSAKHTYSKKSFFRLSQIFVLFFFFLLFLSLTLFSNIGSRAKDIVFLSSPKIIDKTNEALYRSTVFEISGKRMYANKVVSGAYLLAENYISHFDLTYLYFNQHLSSRHGFSHHGNLLLATLPLLMVGVLNINRKSKNNLFFAFWLITAPIASALSEDVPHSGRTLIALPAYIFFISQGICVSIYWLDKKIRNLLKIQIDNLLMTFFIIIALLKRNVRFDIVDVCT